LSKAGNYFGSHDHRFSTYFQCSSVTYFNGKTSIKGGQVEKHPVFQNLNPEITPHTKVEPRFKSAE